MLRHLIRAACAIALSLMMFPALALDTAGTSCKGNTCRATDGNTAGGDCTGNYCVAGSAGTAGGDCLGAGCQAGNGGTGGGDCIGDYCKAGAGRTGGGNCIGKGCQAGSGGTVGGSCTGAGCQSGGNRGQAHDGATVQNMACCVAWAIAGVVRGTNIVSACNAMQAQNKSPDKCEYRTAWGEMKVLDPVSTAAPNPLPAPPTSLADIINQTRRPPDPRCQFDCQAWNPASNSCVGAPMNGCSR